MLHSQKAYVDLNMVELVESLKPNFLVFLDYFVSRGTVSSDESDLVQSKVTCSGKLNRLFSLLKTKDNGWPQLLNYLREHHQTAMADKLQNDVDGETKDTDNETPKRSVLGKFSLRLAKYYQLNYADLPTMGQSPKHVKDVWVPLQIDGRKEDHLPTDRIDHIELLNRLKSTEGRNVALIKGDPGMGKTTLAKKIAYDWAVNYGTSNTLQFSLVLAVPLRYAGKSDRFISIAIGYFLPILEMDDNILTDLISEINQLGSHLLVILDGLDEYTGYKESPFRSMFAAPFEQSLVYRNVPQPMITFKMIITSRPYACERINEDLFPLRFVILPLDANHLSHFVNLYCETSQGITKVTEYLKVNAKLVIQVPLILTFVCYLADSEDEIPTNMTSLYDNLIRQMVNRENRKEKLAELVNMQKWRESNLVKSTGELAFREMNEAIRVYVEFTYDSLEKSHVTNDSFICGFLLHKYDVTKYILKAEFPHRSIQEFFAALHCYQLMLSGREDKLGDIRKLILRGDSQFGRFLFGICSQEGKFVQMTNWLSPSLGRSGDIWTLADVINRFGTNLLDCASEDNTLMGQRLQLSLYQLEDDITSQMPTPLDGLRYEPLRLRHLSAEFKDSLHLVDLLREPIGDTADWYVADNRQSVQLAVVSSRLSELLAEKLDRINILIWIPPVLRTSEMKWTTICSQIKSLPLVRTFIMSTELYSSSPNTTVFVSIDYGRTTGLELTNFQFYYDREQRKELLEAVPDEKLVRLTETKRKEKSDSMEESFIDINVTVGRCGSQSALIFSLIRLSLLDSRNQTRLDSRHKSRRCVIG